MTFTPGLFDILLAVTLLVLAWQLLEATDVFSGIVLFMLFGLLTALAWVRLRAPDIALAEAAIGAGLTGALFLGALGRMEAQDPSGAVARARPGSASKTYHVLLLLPLVGLAVVLCRGLGLLPMSATGLLEGVEAALGQSGAENRVTAVILNFRGYDTLLEIGVLFLAVIAVSALHAADPAGQRRALPPVGWVINVFLHILTPLLVVTAGYLLWIGAHAPGGAFQAGAVLAALGVVLLLTGARVGLTLDKASRRWAAVVGLLVFLVAGAGMMAMGRNFLEYAPQSAKQVMLVIEVAATVSIAFILATLFAGCAGLLGSGTSHAGSPGNETS